MQTERDETPNSNDNDLANQMKSAMMLAIANRAFIWEVKSQKIIETDGKISEDGQIATVSIPLSEMIEGNSKVISRYVLFDIREQSFWNRLFQ